MAGTYQLHPDWGAAAGLADFTKEANNYYQSLRLFEELDVPTTPPEVPATFSRQGVVGSRLRTTGVM